MKSVCPRIFAFVAGLLVFGTNSALADSLSVSAAVSLKEALIDVAKAYQAETHDRIDFTYGSSGQLAIQIRNGAPVDVFISAANKEVDDLSRAGLVNDATRRVVAGNELVLIVPADSKGGPTGFDQLKDPALKRIAIGEPRTVPAGQYAMQVLTGLKLDKELAPRLIFGSNVRQVLDYVERGEVSAGIVYATDAIQAGPKVKVVATAEPSMHEPIVLPAVVVKASRKKATAIRFIDFIASEKGQTLLAARGFTRARDAVPATMPSK